MINYVIDPLCRKKLPDELAQLFRMMRITTLLIIAGCMHLSATSLSQTVTLRVNNQPITKIFETIEKQTDYQIIYSDRFIKSTKPVTLAAKRMALADFLEILLAPEGLTYQIKERTILIAKSDTNPESGVLRNVRETTQERIITGRVVNESGDPLAGVTVSVKGQTTTMITDADGWYRITVHAEGKILVFTMVGFDSLEKPLNAQSVVNVVLTPSLSDLDEVVVVGYGTVKKRDLTGSVSSLGEKDFNTGAQANVTQLIQGRIPGVHVTQSSGTPGAGASIRIRGTNSITAGNEPLFVIDGFPGAPLNALDPGDIESIEVLKDASSAAIYGSRGANGVILITTKKGKVGKMVVNYNGSIGSQSPAKKLDLLNGEQYMTFINGVREDRGQAPLFSQAEINAIGTGTDWQDEIFREAVVQSHKLSFSGGSENGTRYYISLNHFGQDGIVVNSGLNRYGARINFNHSTDRVKFGLNLNASVVTEDNIPLGTGINIGAGVIGSALQMDPVMKPQHEDGSYVESTTQDLNNPLALAKATYHTLKTNRTFGNAFFEYLITDRLSAKINLGTNQSIGRNDDYTTKVTKLGQLNNGLAHIGSAESTDYLSEITLNYHAEIEGQHTVDAVAGYTYQVFVNRGYDATSRDFPTDAFRTSNLSAGNTELYTQSSYKNKNQILSWLGRVNYAFRDRYLATISFRADGSSRFGVDNQYGYFPSMALGWRISDEPFFGDNSVFSDLKLRASYGTTGNQEIGNYNSLVLLGTVGDAIFDGGRHVAIVPIQLANPNLKWETTRQLNAGLDFGVWNNRVTGSLDYFASYTYDLLLNLPIPRTSGFNTSLQNVGDTENKGFELMINSRNLVGDFSWSSAFNFSTVENKVTNLGSLPFILQGDVAFLSDFTILREGDPINSYWGYQVDGIFQTQEEIDQSAQPRAKVGDLRFKDVNKSGSITADDRTILGNPFPDFTLGLNNSFEYKGFQLDVFLEGRFGYEMLNFSRIDSESPIQDLRNRQSYVLNRWTSENPSNEHPSFVGYDRAVSVNSRVVEDASFLRLKTVQLNYTFPPSFRPGGITALSIYASAQNIFTVTDYTGYDPDVSSFGDNNIRLDYNAYPLPRIVTVGVNLTL